MLAAASLGAIWTSCSPDFGYQGVLERFGQIKPKILILDDSTSAVDVETEVEIENALEALMDDTTSFIVAQRISTILKADKILVLDNGRIAAEGNHKELMDTSPLYREIYNSQLGDEGVAA
jgi:ATP-binding cassette subfamily B protein